MSHVTRARAWQVPGFDILRRILNITFTGISLFAFCGAWPGRSLKVSAYSAVGQFEMLAYLRWQMQLNFGPSF